MDFPSCLPNNIRNALDDTTLNRNIYATVVGPCPEPLYILSRSALLGTSRLAYWTITGALEHIPFRHRSQPQHPADA